jgi:sugar-specific transcriptional regulator TrmB
MNKNLYFTANEISEMLGISRGHAYKIVKKLNNELAEKGFIVISGRVPKKFFAEHYYGMELAQ